MTKDTEQYRDVAIKSLAVLGLMTILALGSFLTLTALAYVPTMVRAVGTFVASTTPQVGTSVVNVTNQITQNSVVRNTLGLKTTNSAIPSGSSVVVSWDRPSAEAGGSYTLSFPCVSGVTVSHKGSTLFCNIPYNIDQDAEQITLSVTSKKNHTSEMSFTLRYTKNGENRVYASDTIAMGVINASIADPATPKPVAMATTPKPSKPPYVPPYFSSVGSYIGSYIPGVPSYNSTVFLPTTITTPSPQWGEADLRPIILEMGILDQNTKQIIPTRFMSRTSKAAVRFAIENIGTKTSAPWVFNATLPTSPRFTYLPEFQPPLKPGERIEYTLSFDRIVNDDNSIVITVDPAGTLPEATKTNNTARVDFVAF